MVIYRTKHVYLHIHVSLSQKVGQIHMYKLYILPGQMISGIFTHWFPTIHATAMVYCNYRLIPYFLMTAGRLFASIYKSISVDTGQYTVRNKSDSMENDQDIARNSIQ